MSPKEAVMGFLGYCVIGLVTAYFARFAADRPDNDAGNGIIVAIGVVWPISLTMLLLIVCIRMLKKLSPLTARMDWLVSKALKQKVHADEYGVLYRAPSPYGEICFVKVQDSTGVYWLTVPREMERAKQAVAWTYNMNEDDYHPVRV